MQDKIFVMQMWHMQENLKEGWPHCTPHIPVNVHSAPWMLKCISICSHSLCPLSPPA